MAATQSNTQIADLLTESDDRQSPASKTVGVLHVINGEHYAGAERVQDLLAGRLPQFGFEVGFACVKLARFGELRQSRETPLFDARMRSKFDLRPAREIARIVRRDGYRLIHGHTVRTALVGALAARLAGVPFVYHVHSPTSRNGTGRWSDRANAFLERLCLRKAARLIAVSESLAGEMIRRGYPSERIGVVHNGVSALYELPFRAAPRGRWTLGTVALFRPRKGLEVLLDALAILRRNGCPIRLKAVGAFETPEYQRAIRERAVRLGLNEIIEWTGFTCDVTSELLTLDLFALPSLFGEGLPMVILEAMAAGVPVVASAVEGVPEAIRDGRDGLLTIPGDADDMARKITAVIDGRTDWQSLRLNAIERQGQYFSDESMARGVAKVYRGVLG
ncbi:MAG: glycosyltransferase [Pirellulales bacterium]|nr:glycosyltransferase [Pirellulales bacterium]